MASNTEYYSSPKALELVAEISRELQHSSELALITAKRKQGFDPELIRFALEQAALRTRAEKKFPLDKDQMLFTEPGLEQATRSEVAGWHAELFKAAGIKSVTDLGCGIGADSIAFAKAGLEVVAVDQNQDAVAAAKHNLKGFPRAKVLLADAEEYSVETAGVFLDPARRDQIKKSSGPVRLKPEDFSPGLNFVFDLTKKYPALIKLSPGFPHELLPAEFEANWVSHDGDLVEVLLRSKELGVAGVRRAVMVGPELHAYTGSGRQAEIRKLGNYLFEPDASLIRSHLLGDFAAEHDLGLISTGIGYLTADQDFETPWLRRYRVLETLPLKEKEIRDYCSKNQIGRLEIKKRGVDITPEMLRPKLRLKGTGAATLVLTKVGDAHQAIVCEPIR